MLMDEAIAIVLMPILLACSCERACRTRLVGMLGRMEMSDGPGGDRFMITDVHCPSGTRREQRQNEHEKCEPLHRCST